MHSPLVRTRAFWVCTGITLISAIISAGYSTAALFAQTPTDTYALYAASRSLALLVAVVLCVVLRSEWGIVALAVTMSLVQLLDGLIGIHVHDAIKTFGPLFTALLNVAALVWLLGYLRAR